MRRLTTIAVLGTLALAACSKPAETPEAAATTEAAATDTTPAAVAPAPGEYAVSDKDGKAQATTTLNADGTYRDVPVKGLPEAGLWKFADGKTCFDPSGPKEPTCYTDGPRAADGSFSTTADDGTVLNVKPVAK